MNKKQFPKATMHMFCNTEESGGRLYSVKSQSKSLQQKSQLRFPEKLLTIIDKTTDMITWNRNGTTILLNTEALDEYLLSDQSLFRTKTNLSFLRQLHHYGFKRVPRSIPKNIDSPTVLEFRHQYFKEDFPENLDKVKRCASITVQDRNYISGTNSFANQRYRFDPCFQRLKKLSVLERSRLRLKLVLQMEKLRYLIVKKVEECRESNNFVIELTADKFENTVESVFNFNQSHIAGYYGEVENTAIKDFFGPYLPTYANEEDVGSADGVSVSNEQQVLSSQDENQNQFVSVPGLDYQLNYSISQVPSHSNSTVTSNGNDGLNSSFSEFTEIHYGSENQQIDNSVNESPTENDSNNQFLKGIPSGQQEIPIEQTALTIKWELDLSNSGEGNSNGTIHVTNETPNNGIALDLSYAAEGCSSEMDDNQNDVKDIIDNKDSDIQMMSKNDNGSDIFSEIRESIGILYD